VLLLKAPAVLPESATEIAATPLSLAEKRSFAQVAPPLTPIRGSTVARSGSRNGAENAPATKLSTPRAKRVS
jgi:hypothetical protein